MTKRKRENNASHTVGIGLGATLASIREASDIVTDELSTNKDNSSNDNWILVGSKRRKKGDLPALKSPVYDPSEGHDDSKEQTAERKQRRKERKLARHYPAIEHSHHSRLQSHIKISDIQALVLYLLADGQAPQWVSVRSRSSIQRVVMLMVPGLDADMFNSEPMLEIVASPTNSDHEGISHARTEVLEGEGPEKQRFRLSPDDFYPVALRSRKLPAPLRPLAAIFDHLWPVKSPGDHRANQYIKLHSPVHSMLTSQIPKSQEEKQMKKRKNHKGPIPQDSRHWDNKRTRITEFLISLTDQQENEYVPHPAMFSTVESREAALCRRRGAKQGPEDGWVDTNVQDIEDGFVPETEIEQGSITGGREVISVDCEMCKDENDDFVLTRVSLLHWNGTVILDKLVKPNLPIKDYLTQWSGITAAMLENVTTTLSDIQNQLRQLITPRTILVGHSLNSDLNALKLTHPFLVDTGILYPHPRGPPYKQSLKWLAQKYLHREVQKGMQGHDSVEDARTCLDLVKQKCEKGPAWGTGNTNAESLFKRLGRSLRPQPDGGSRVGAVIDWGDPNRGHGCQAQLSVGCKSDDEVVDEIHQALKGLAIDKGGDQMHVDFIWGRLRELELSRGWWDDATHPELEAARQSARQRLGFPDEPDQDTPLDHTKLAEAVSESVSRINRIYQILPSCTAFVVYSGIGDPRPVRHLQNMYQQYRREYETKNWDNLSVKWTDTEAQALSKACQQARNGIAMIGVK